MDGANFLELRDGKVTEAGKICWVCAGSGGKDHQCPECGGRGFNPKRSVPPPKSTETKLLLTENHNGRKV